jgi:hypothetical protein
MSDDKVTPRPGEPVPNVWERLLTPKEVHAATKWINDRSVKAGDACLVCESENSLVQPGITAMPGGVSPYNDGKNWVHPCVVVICQNCGFQRYFNAVIMGLADGDNPAAGES